MKLKTWSMLGAALLFALTSFGPADKATASPSDVTVTFNGQQAKTSVSPYIENGTTFVPVELISRIKGLTARWIPNEQTARLWVDRGSVMDLKPGTAYVDDWGTRYPLSAPITVKKGNVMLPLRFIAELAGANLTWDKEHRTIDVSQSRTAIAAVPGTRNRLYPLEEKEGMFKGIQLEWEGMRKTFPWTNPSSVVSPPRLYVEDISGDGIPEAVVTLNRGRGTGLFLEEVRIIDRAGFKEVPVDDPLDSIKGRVTSSIDKSGPDVKITVTIDGKKMLVAYPASDFGGDPSWLFDELKYGAVISYSIQGKKLTATLGASSGMSTFAGDLNITYALEQGRYTAKSMTFSPEK